MNIANKNIRLPKETMDSVIKLGWNTEWPLTKSTFTSWLLGEYGFNLVFGHRVRFDSNSNVQEGAIWSLYYIKYYASKHNKKYLYEYNSIHIAKSENAFKREKDVIKDGITWTINYIYKHIQMIIKATEQLKCN